MIQVKEADIAYADAADMIEAAIRSGRWSEFQKRVLGKRIRWQAYVVSSEPPKYIIRPRKAKSPYECEDASVSLEDRTNREGYSVDEPVIVSGMVAQFDSEGITISAAKIERK